MAITGPGCGGVKPCITDKNESSGRASNRNGRCDSRAIVKTIGESEGSRILAQPEKASPWLQNQLANLTILYEASQAVSHILDVPQLLQKLLELIFRSIPADRGIALLTAAKGDPQPAAIHWRKESRDFLR